MSARERVPRRGVSGRTHRSAPTRWGRRSEPTENWREDGPCQRGEREWTDGGVWSPRPTGATQVMPSSGPMWASAPTERRESRINHPGQRRRAKRLRRGREGWVGIGAGIIPEGASSRGQSLSHGEAVPAPGVPKAWPPPTKRRWRLVGGHGAQNSLLAYAHRILTAATPFCSLFPPLAALANVPLCTREPLGDGPWAAAARKTRGRHAGSAGLMGGFAGKIRLGENFGGFFLLWGAKYPGKALQSQKKYDILAS